MKREDMVAVFVDPVADPLADERKRLEMHLRFLLKGMEALGVPVMHEPGGRCRAFFEAFVLSEKDVGF